MSTWPIFFSSVMVMKVHSPLPEPADPLAGFHGLSKVLPPSSRRQITVLWAVVFEIFEPFPPGIILKGLSRLG